jgi:predicted GNAT family acetyltransferase
MKDKVIHDRNRFYKTVEGLNCELEYIFYDDNTINFFHTYVPETLRGRGIAMEIIREGVDFAVAHKYKIIPSCSAVRKFMDRNPKYREFIYR